MYSVFPIVETAGTETLKSPRTLVQTSALGGSILFLIGEGKRKRFYGLDKNKTSDEQNEICPSSFFTMKWQSRDEAKNNLLF